MISTRNATLLIALPLLLAGLACGAPDAEAPAPSEAAPVAARIATASPTELADSLAVTGSTAAWARVSPAAKIMARIDEMPVSEGQWVDRGQMLARLDARDLAAADAQARAAVSMAEAQLDNARAQESRMRRLLDRGSATEKNLEDAVAALKVAEASLAQAQANVQATEVMLDYAEIAAPTAGWVTSKMAEMGDTTAPGRPLLTIEDRSRMKVVLQVPETSAATLQRGDAVQLRIDVLDLSADARVDRILPREDGSRTFNVQVVLDNPDGRVRSGMFVRATLPLGERSALLVPQSAIVRRGQLEGIFVLDDQDRARVRWLRLGAPHGSQVEVLAGLDTGDRYLPDPPPGLADGTPVRGA
jgi:RND family efflux transporter MFP subunit